jgi:GNAT superfamily N-acetyltransferase
MTVRQLSGVDAAAYQPLRLLGLQECPTAFSASFAEEANRSLEEVATRMAPTPDGSFCLFGAFAGEHLVGHLAFIRPVREKVRHCALLGGMYVAPEFRRLGHGGALLDRVLAHTEACAGVRQVKLAVNSTNTAARALYRSRGFVCVGVEPDALCIDGYHYDEELYVLRFTSVGSPVAGDCGF